MFPEPVETCTWLISADKKTLLQTRGSSTDERIRKAKGMAEALRIIRERDGWKGLRRGMGPRVMTVAPSTAISWLSYEFFSEYFIDHDLFNNFARTQLIQSQRSSSNRMALCQKRAKLSKCLA